MQPTGNLADLAERMKEKTEQERQQIENIVSAELTTLRRSLNDATQNALSTIKRDMEQQIQNARETLKEQSKILSLSFGQRWLATSLIALAAIIGITMGGWGLTKLAERKAMNLRQEISQLQQQQAKLETTVKQLQAQTWGLELADSPEGRFIILPPKATAKTGWTHGTRQAIKVE